MSLTIGEQRMCWHAARGQITPLPPDEVNEINWKIGELEIALAEATERAERAEAQVGDLRETLDRIRHLCGLWDLTDAEVRAAIRDMADDALASAPGTTGGEGKSTQ